MSPINWQNHVFYRARDGHIHKLFWKHEKGWKHADVSAKSNAPEAAGRPSGYHYKHKGTQHIIYRGKDNHIHEIYFRPGENWKHNNLTERTGAPLAIGRPFGYEYDEDNSQQVVYRGTDNNVYELYYHPGNGWNYTNLTQRTGAALAAGGPTAYIFGNQNHVIYRGVDNHIHHLHFSREKDWKTKNLTASINAPLAINNPIGHELTTNNSQHIFYISSDNHVQELWWKHEKGWRNSDLTSRTNAGLAQGTMACYVFNGQDHLVYRGTDSVIHELFFSPENNWKHSNLSLRLNAPNTKTDPIGYPFEIENSQHVVYVGIDENVHDLSFRKGDGWKYSNLTVSTGAPPAASGLGSYLFFREQM